MQTHSALRRSNRLAPIDSSPPPNDRKRPQDDEPEPNPMAPKKPKKVTCFIHLKNLTELTVGFRGLGKASQSPTNDNRQP